MPDASFEITTRLDAPAENVWEAALSPEGINHELGPWVRMTLPKGIADGLTIDTAPLGEKLGRSWIFVAKVLPVDYDDLALAERGPGMRFLERSQLGSARSWQHEREVLAVDANTCEITDRLAIDLRAPLRAVGGRAAAGRIIRALFTHRHRRLAERWGSS